MKHIKKFETLSFQNEVMDVFEEVLDEFSIIHDDTRFPPNNSISYEVLESDSESNTPKTNDNYYSLRYKE